MLDHFSGENFIMRIYTCRESYRENGGWPRLTKNCDLNTVDSEFKMQKHF